MFIKVGKFIITNEKVIRKKDAIDEKKLKREFSARLDHSLRHNCADDVLDRALLALKKA